MRIETTKTYQYLSLFNVFCIQSTTNEAFQYSQAALLKNYPTYLSLSSAIVLNMSDLNINQNHSKCLKKCYIIPDENCYKIWMIGPVDFTTPPISGKNLVVNERKRYHAGIA